MRIFVSLTLFLFSISHAIEYFSSGSIEESDLTSQTVERTFNYIDPKISTTTLEANLTVGSGTNYIKFYNTAQRSITVSFTTSSITIYDSFTNPLVNETFPQLLSNAAHTITLQAEPQSVGSIGTLITLTIYEGDSLKYSKETLGAISFTNKLIISSDTPPPSGDEGSTGIDMIITGYKLSVSSDNSNQRSVVVIPF